MRADPFAQLKLLDVQELDSRLDTLRHQAATLPETVQLRETAARQSDLRARESVLQTEVDDLARAQRKADDDVEQVKARRVRDRQRLDSGAVSNPKDLERLQHELVSLERRIGDLEDVELEVMERLEGTQKELEQVQGRLAELDGLEAQLTRAREERMAGLRAEAGQVARDRQAAVAGMPAELLTLYDRLREQKGGVGAALLRGRRCEGCSLELNSAELAEIVKQPSDEVVRCEECGRILVRTGESGI